MLNELLYKLIKIHMLSQWSLSHLISVQYPFPCEYITIVNKTILFRIPLLNIATFSSLVVLPTRHWKRFCFFN